MECELVVNHYLADLIMFHAHFAQVQIMTEAAEDQAIDLSVSPLDFLI